MKDRTDAELVGLWAAERSEAAFAEVVRRHGGMVYGAGLRLLADAGEAEDAAQAVFMLLARKAGGLSRREALAGWLHGTAALVARERLRARARRARAEKEAGRMKLAETAGPPGDWEALRSALDAALQALPGRSRAALVMFYLEGRPQEEIARELGVPLGTVKSRVSLGLEKLREFLARRGVGLSAAALGAMLLEKGAAAVPASLAARLAELAALSGAMTGSLAAKSMMEGAMKAMFWMKVKVAATGFLGVVLLGGGAATVTALAAAGSNLETAPALPPPPVQCGAPLAGHVVEHVAFALAASRRPIGGPARWAVGHGEVLGSNCQKFDGKVYTGGKDCEVPLYFWNQWRQIWIVEKGEAWPIIGSDDLADEDGPAEFAKFKGDGVYGGFLGAMSSSGHTLYMSFGGLRRIQRQEDGSWRVDTVGGKGKKTSLAAGEEARLADLGALGSMCADDKGNMFFIQSGGIIKVTPEGRATSVITREKVQKDFQEVCDRKWPGAKPRAIELGSGEGCSLLIDNDGTLFGGGRTYPSGWKVTPAGQFVPICNYAQGPCPADVPARSSPWGPGAPAYYQPGCSYGIGISEGYLFHVNESTSPPLSRYEIDRNQVTTLQQDGTWSAVSKAPWGAFFQPMVDGTMAGNAPRNCNVMWVRMRKAPSTGAGQR